MLLSLLALQLALLLAPTGCCHAADIQSPLKAGQLIISRRVFSVADYGGRSGEGGNNTAAFAKAIRACEIAGGGTVRVPAGTWVSGGIRLISHMTLLLEDGATIKGITPPTPAHISIDYPIYNGSSSGVRGPQPLVLVDGCTNLTIDGPGTLDGNGPPFWVWANLWPGFDYNNASDPPTPMAGRPSVLRLINCSDVVWRGFRVLRSPFWATQIIGSRRVLVDRVRIHVNDSNYCPTPGGRCYQPTNEDGLDIAASQHVVVRNSEIYSHDDSIALLAGSGWWPDNNDLYNVTIENNTFTSEQAAIALDTAWGCGSCRIHDVVVRNCRVGLPGWAAAETAAAVADRDGSVGAHPPPCQLRKLPWDSPYGCRWPMTGQVVHARGGPGSNGTIANVLVTDISAGDVMMVVFLAMCLGYDPATPCPNATAHVAAGTALPSFSNMTFRRIHTRYAAERFIDLFGIAGHEQISGIVLEDLGVGSVGLVEGGEAVRCDGTQVAAASRVTVAGKTLPHGAGACW
jgi:hypothetical protein